MPHPSDTTEIAERFGSPLPPGDTAIEPPAPACISGDRQRLRNLRKCTSLAEWLELGETRSPNPGGTSARISLHMLRSAHLPEGYGFEFDRLLRRVSLRHCASGVVIHGQPLLVSCDDAFDGELRYHYCSFEVFSRLINSQQFDSSIWRHQCTTKKEPSAFDTGLTGLTGLEGIARVLGISQRQNLQYCIPLRQAPPLGVDHLPSEPDHSDADVEPLEGAQTASDEEARGAACHIAIPVQFPEQEGLTAHFFETETSADERSEGSRSQRSQYSQRRRSQEQKELLEMLHRQRKAAGAKEKPVKELPAVAKEFLLSTMLEWRHITATNEMKDLGWVIPSRHSLRVWAKIPYGGQLKFAFQSQASGVSVTRSDQRWTLISKDETVRSEASEASECWFEFRRHNASSEIRVGHGLSTDSPPVARVATKVLGEMKVCLQADKSADVELGHDAFVEANMGKASQDLSKLASAVDLKDASGTPVLTHAVRGGNLAVVTALLTAKANVHARDAKLCTALHYSAHDGNAEAAKVLLQAGASAFARNCSGATPRDVALLRWTPRVQSDGFESEDRITAGHAILEVFKTLGRERKSS